MHDQWHPQFLPDFQALTDRIFDVRLSLFERRALAHTAWHRGAFGDEYAVLVLVNIDGEPHDIANTERGLKCPICSRTAPSAQAEG